MKFNILLLILILFLAGFLRIYKLDKVPSGFFCDEAERGVSAYSLFHSGKDWHNKSWPIFFQAFGEYVGPIQTYSMIPFIAIFGKNEIAVRLTSVFWSLLGIVGIYLLIEKLYKNGGIAGALIMALLPWSIHYARYGTEITTYLTFFIFGFWATLSAKENEKMIIFAGVIWAIFGYTYTPAYLFTPIMWIGSVIYFLHHKRNFRLIIISTIVYLILSIPLALHILSGEGLVRFKQTTQDYSRHSLMENVKNFFTRYFYQYSPRFFLKGEKTFITRHFIEGLKPVPIIFLIFSIIGFLYLLFKNKIHSIFWLLFFYPIGGAIPSDGGPTTTRSIIGVVLVVILSIIGLFFIWNLSNHPWFKRLVFLVISFGIIFHLISFWHFYFYIYPKRSSDFWGWQYGPREILKVFKRNEKEYQQFIMSREFNAGEIFFKFYYPECKNCKIFNDSLIEFPPKTMFALRPNELELIRKEFRIVEVIYYPNGEVAFFIGETLK